MAIAPKSTTKITEGQLRRIVRSEIATALPHRRSMSESPYRPRIENSWTYDENGVGLDGSGSVVAAWERFTAACVALSRFADMSFPEMGDSPAPMPAGSGMVSVLEMAKHQVDVILDEQ